MIEIDEKKLIIELKQGDQLAFTQLFNAYAHKVFYFAKRYYNSEASASEIVQEVFYKIWQKRELLDEHQSIKTFIYTIAKNLILNNLKKNVLEKAYNEYARHSFNFQTTDLQDEIIYSDLQHIAEKAIQELPYKRKQVYRLSRIEGFTNSEIAEKLNLSVRTVETHISLALKFLKEKLKVYTDIAVIALLSQLMNL